MPSIFRMEQQLSSFPILFTILLFFTLLKIWKKSNVKNSSQDLPPGPWKLPLIGSMHHLTGSLPHHCLRDLAKKYGPLMHIQLGEVTNIIISSPEMAMQVMKTHDVHFAQRPFLFSASVGTYNYTDIIFAPYGDYWRRMRKVCTMELLATKRVQSFRSIRGEEVSKFITTIGSSINFSFMFNSLIYSIVSRIAFGKIWKGEEILIPALKKMTQDAGGFTLADLYPSVKFLHVASGMKNRTERLHRVVDKIYEDIIDEHRARKTAKARDDSEGEEDLVDVLINLQDQGEDVGHPLTTENLKAIVQDMFAGGIDTTATTAEWAMAELLKNPRAMRKAQEEVRRVFGTKGNIEEARLQELNYLKLVIKETLRLHAPLPFIPRECRNKCMIDGYDIPAKSKVMVNVWAIGRDPNYWAEPEKFNPERFLDCCVDYKGTNFELLPFGAGRRMCPGMSFGIANVELPLAQLLYHFDWKLPTGITPENLNMDEVFGVVLKRKNDLQVIPTPYIPTPAK